MAERMNRAQRQSAFLESATRMFNQLEDWYEQHPNASFAELESQARAGRWALMGEVLAVLINGRMEGYQFEPPRCIACEQVMKFAGYRPRTIYGLEGDTQLSRAYYVCESCDEQTLFPPGSAIASARRPLE